ncbi:MAG: signal peptidase II [Acholeplasmataceae bacterium]
MIGAGILIGILVIVDQLTKYLAKFFLNGKDPFELISNIITLSYQTNDGASFGILSGNRWLFVLITFVALGFFFYLLKSANLKTKKTYSIGVSLLIAGTIGNLLDRIFHGGHVIDFLYVHLYDPIMNVFGLDNFYNNFADMFLFVGIFMFAIDLIFFESKRNKQTRKNGETSNDSI